MNHAITVADLVWPAAIFGGVLAVAVVIIVIMSIFASQWRH